MLNISNGAPQDGANTNSQATPSSSQPAISSTSSSNPLKQLVGKSVYLDLNNSYKLLKKVKECLSYIEAKIADCLSKDVNFLITNRDTSESSNTPVSSNSLSSSQNEDSAKKLKTSPNAILLSRSHSLLVNRTQKILGQASKTVSNDLLSTARRLGIHIIHVSEIERHVEKFTQRKKSLESNEINNSVNTSINSTSVNNISLNNNDNVTIKCTTASDKLTTSNHKIYKLKGAFLKFESVCKQYKPIYQEFKVWHDINLDIQNTKSTNSPFNIYFSDDAKSSISSKRSESSSSSSSNKPNNVNNEPFQNQTKQPVFKSPTSSTLITSNTNNNSTQNTLNNSKMSVNSSSIHANLNKQNMMFNQNSSMVLANNKNLVPNPNLPAKKKPTGYCECCKLRYDNLKQHLTSAQHENFDKNLNNFKELDEYINGVLNFTNFLVKNNLDMQEEKNENPESPKENVNTATKPSSVQNENLSFNDVSKKRKRFGSFTPQVLEVLNDAFKKTSQPTSAELEALGDKLNFDPELIRIWFNDKQKTVKNSIKKFKKGNLVNSLAINLNGSSFTDNDTSMSSVTFSPCLNNHQSPSVSHKLTKSQSILGTNQSANNCTPFRSNSTQSAQNLINNFKKTPSLVSSLSLSSPSAAVLFNLNSNSFSMPNENLNTTPIHNSATKLLASKVDMMNSTSEMPIITASANKRDNESNMNNMSREENSTDLSCLDEAVIAAFINDFSYEIVQK